MRIRPTVTACILCLALVTPAGALASPLNESFSLNPAKRTIEADWVQAYSEIKGAQKRSLRLLAVCEGGGRNTTHGYYGWTHWAYIGSLDIPNWMHKRRSPSAQSASFKEQTVITAAVANRYGYGGWPSCSRRLGLR